MTRKLRIWSHLPEKSLMENFIFCAVTTLWSRGRNYWIAPKWHSIYLQTIASKVFLSVKLFFSCRVLPASFRFVPFKLKQDCTSNDINLWEKGILARIKVYEMGINSYLFNLVFIFIFKTYHLLTKSWPVNM